MPAGQGEQILVIDDEVAVLAMIRETLETYNYRVLTAKDGAEALDLYKQNKAGIRLVISDMMMPVMDGPATLGALRQLDSAVKVIAVSGLGSESALNRIRHLNVQALLRKPFTPQELLTTLRHTLDGGAEAS